MTDPNWFYSALAQSAAAIVGLIGAFVTSKVMMMAGERSRIEKRIHEVNAEIKELERQNAPLIEEVDRKDEEQDRKNDEESVNDFLRAKKPELNLEKLPTTDEMLKELREGNRINIFDDKFAYMFKEEYKALKEEIRMEEEAQPKRILGIGGLVSGIRSADLTNLSIPRRIRSTPDPRYKKYREIIEENNNKISYKDAKIQELQHQFNQITLPVHFKRLIHALIYFSIVGVIVPLWLLPITEVQHLFWKPIVFLLFITGFVAVFRYIFIEIMHITKKQSNSG